jgi:hypothetical protein
VLGYAVRKKRLSANPLNKANLPEGWSVPLAPEDEVDPRAVGGPEQVADMLAFGRRESDVRSGAGAGLPGAPRGRTLAPGGIR